jgi:uncharacterized protein
VKVSWDERKRARNIAERGLDFADVEAHFDLNTALILPSYPGLDGRFRFKAIGPLRRRLVVLIFSPLGTETIAVISLRPANRKEARLYDQS